MKNKTLALGFLCVALAGVSAQTQSTTVAQTPAPSSLEAGTAVPAPTTPPAAPVASSPLVLGHYSITVPDGYAKTQELAEAFNAFWAAFNEVFRFNPDTNGRKCNIVILPNKAAFDAYISERIGESRDQYVFLKYANPDVSQLVLYPNGTAEGYAAFAGPALNRQLFLQYLYGFVAEPPVWVRDGFQAWFERLTWNPTTKAIDASGYPAWLETAKRQAADPALRTSIGQILAAVTGAYDSARLYPQEWAFVAFLLSSETPIYQRFGHDTCVLLEGETGYNAESQQQNTDRIRNRFARYQSEISADADFARWLGGQKTFNELLQAGVSAYNGGNFSDANKQLLAAYAVRGTDPMVLYYLGLLAYSEKRYAEADAWYQKSLAAGGETSTINWALGLSAYADKRFAEAKRFIDMASSSNAARYGEKAKQILKSMPKQ